ncbi:hypothetical protein A3Q56_01949 [Intoshia linei]|uniref:Uncharacterized protein n=1 Tax=Intoshia linei TaxID=1819745 RepID=A0A177B9F5_9BILA|nr:hypothetical protein A3Q56_01949 [Intoshia linei]
MTMKMLYPEYISDNERSNINSSHFKEFFKHIKVDNLSVTEMCDRTGTKLPITILQEFLKRNLGTLSNELKFSHTILDKQIETTLTFGDLKETVITATKKEGKNYACQLIIKKLHPDIHDWNGIMELYEKCEMDDKNVSIKRKEIYNLALQDKPDDSNKENMILSKLRQEMFEIYK